MANYVLDAYTPEKRALEGVKCAYSGMYIDAENGITMINRNRKNRVALLCGANSNYDPFGAGFVGEGMLTAHVSGSISQPPTTKIITKVIHNLAKLNTGGILVLLLNYPIQVLNFGLAIERARLKGINIESFAITDDCSRIENVDLVGFEENLALRRGLSGCAFAIKILGTMSSLGYKLWEILDHAMNLNFRMATIGFTTHSFTMPGLQTPSFNIPKGEVAIGCGFLGDQGVYNIQVTNLRDIVKETLPKAIKQSGLRRRDTCCILINNMGIVTNIELYCVANEVDQYLGHRGICIARMYVGTVMTYYNTKGVLISILNCAYLPEWVHCLDICTEAFAWPGSRLSHLNPKWPLRTFGSVDISEQQQVRRSTLSEEKNMILNEKEAKVFRKCLVAACEALIEKEDIINRLNALTGNGDCGSNMRNYSEHLLRKMQDMPCNNVANTFYTCSLLADEVMSGTVGTLYSIGLNGAGMEADCWVDCWESAINQIMKHTSAKLGFRTLLDALVPAYEIFVDRLIRLGEDAWLTALYRAVEYAECGSFKTAYMVPKVGRAKYSASKITNMDAGAYGVYVWLRAVRDALNEYVTSSLEEESNHKKISANKSFKHNK